MLSERQGLHSCYRINGDQVDWDREANGYHLPTEAEWEYAVRAGTTTRWFFGGDDAELDRYAWFTGNSGGRVHPVGEKESNPWGLHDMIGNVWEWCWDWYGNYSKDAAAVIDPIGSSTGVSRVLRGGAYWIGAGGPAFRGPGRRQARAPARRRRCSLCAWSAPPAVSPGSAGVPAGNSGM